MKQLLPAALMLLCLHSYAQVSHAYNPTLQGVDPMSQKAGLTNLEEDKDDMTGITMYHDPRMSPHNLRGSGIFAIIVKRKDNNYVLKLVAYHVMQYGQTAPLNATGVLIKTTDTLFAFENPDLIHGNGGNMVDISIIGSTTDKNNFVYKIFSRIIATGFCKLRFESTSQIDDYILSAREVSEIKNVVDGWLSVNKIE